MPIHGHLKSLLNLKTQHAVAFVRCSEGLHSTDDRTVEFLEREITDADKQQKQQTSDKGERAGFFTGWRRAGFFTNWRRAGFFTDWSRPAPSTRHPRRVH